MEGTPVILDARDDAAPETRSLAAGWRPLRDFFPLRKTSVKQKAAHRAAFVCMRGALTASASA
jgi:hypothetical protein